MRKRGGEIFNLLPFADLRNPLSTTLCQLMIVFKNKIKNKK
jgi:hypothetical protein